MIEAWMAAEGLKREDCHIRFYSDHKSDAPVLLWPTSPLRPTRHAGLRELAKRKGWPILEFLRSCAALQYRHPSAGWGLRRDAARSIS